MTPSSYQAVNPTTKSCEAANNNSIYDDDTVVYDEIPHFKDTADAATSKRAESTAMQLTVNTAYQQGIYRNVVN